MSCVSQPSQDARSVVMLRNMRSCSLGSIKREAKTIFWEDGIPVFFLLASICQISRISQRANKKLYESALLELFLRRSTSILSREGMLWKFSGKKWKCASKSLACSLQRGKKWKCARKSLACSHQKMKDNAWTCIARFLQPGSTLKYCKKKSEIIILSLKSF